MLSQDLIGFSVQGCSWDTVSLPIEEVALGFALDPLVSIFSEVTGVECGCLSTLGTWQLPRD